MAQTLSSAELRVRIARLPRVPLGHFPTPLEFCPRLTEAVGGPRIFIKRDDCTGLAFGGNKTRQLEFTVAAGIQQGADVLVGGAGSQSNHCRQLAAAAKQGLDCALVVVKDHKSHVLQGNLLVDDLVGASVEMVEVDSQEQLGDAKQELVDRLRQDGRKPFVVMQRENQHLGAMAYALCMAELADQLGHMGERADTLVTCSGSTTQPGLIFGNKVLGMGVRIIGMAPIRWSHDLKTAFLDILARMDEVLELDMPFTAEDIINLDSYIGPRGYGYPSAEGNAALRLMARSEGILLDPIYSAKAVAGLIELVHKGEIGAYETVVFLHTGGTPALFSYAEELAG
ncbi:MAG: D-cysteine desulfhydrase family protein [Candidatus Latescibacteria bacterium]|nr:D-cysteine desulfhydrase family protein [Candidatus Latescibacterota bacterium]